MFETSFNYSRLGHGRCAVDRNLLRGPAGTLSDPESRFLILHFYLLCRSSALLSVGPSVFVIGCNGEPMSRSVLFHAFGSAT